MSSALTPAPPLEPTPAKPRVLDERDARVLALLRERGAAPVMDVAKAIGVNPPAARAALSRLRLRGLVFLAGTAPRGARWGEGGPAVIWEAVPQESE
ncbi:MAG: hypothetical protein AVDCRST_MAG77-1105 [uncultured Chloroflexi bacterium]|uniref:HTH asnC-type domain-containing protein n=1 Tax=uncultured Chloroflexota bacterium TaxID=166587 RepID=A0A6J4HTM1_9CHLR|nr:MAG: hypothetical protein AVDCRST_MAG77-1105 [uncultured Chloroflexota bacterium]